MLAEFKKYISAGVYQVFRTSDRTDTNLKLGPLPVIAYDAAGNPLSAQGSGDLVSVTLTTDTSIYADGDVLADTQPVAAATRANDADALLRHLLVIDADNQRGALDVHFFSANRSLGAENGAPNISDANALDWLGKIPVTAVDYYNLGGVAVAKVDGGLLRLEPAAGTQIVYVGVISRDTKTYSATGLTLKLGVDWE